MIILCNNIMKRLKRGLDNDCSDNNIKIMNIKKIENKSKANVINILYKINKNYKITINDPSVYDNLPIVDIPKGLIFRKEKIIINREINNITDLLSLLSDYPISVNAEYNINIEKLSKIKEPLEKLHNMIGMTDIKNNILNQILFYVQNLHVSNNLDYKHTVIYGPPGTGKTEVAKIIGTIFSNLDILKKGTFKKVTRADLIAGYLGQTALKTRDVIQNNLGGVLLIDEAYALGNSEKRDSFSKECIDTLCEALSDHRDELMVIIAGYADELDTCFFSYNQGLKSRFPWVFKTDDYNSLDMKKIFEKKIIDSGWNIEGDLDLSFFENNMSNFKYYGRDMETLLSKTKIAHGRRVFCKPKRANETANYQ